MKNDFFISRCETLLNTMGSCNFEEVTVKQVSQWTSAPSDAAAGQFVRKACELNILQKVGAARNTKYKLTQDCYNSIQNKLRSNGNNMKAAVTYVVDWFVNRSNKVRAKVLTTETGKRLVKIQSSEELDAESKQAIDSLSVVLEQNKKLRSINKDQEAEIELLKEEVDKLRAADSDKDSEIKRLKAEVARLKEFEDKYNQIIQITTK